MDFKYETFDIKRLEHKFALFYCVGRSASCPETTACTQKSPFSACGTEVMQQCYESFDPTSASRAATRGDLQTAKTRGQCNKSLLSFSQTIEKQINVFLMFSQAKNLALPSWHQA